MQPFSGVRPGPFDDNQEQTAKTRVALDEFLKKNNAQLWIQHDFAATAKLKSDEATRSIPIIVLSAHAMSSDRELALAAGGDDFDTKPVRFPPLLEKIERLLAKGVAR